MFKPALTGFVGTCHLPVSTLALRKGLNWLVMAFQL